MKRDYSDGVQDDALFFNGIEVEHSIAHGLHTMFVVGLHSADVIAGKIEKSEKWDSKIEHIFFGANHSFDYNVDTIDDWEAMIRPFLDMNMLCSLDIKLVDASSMLESILIEHNNFIPQLQIPLPYAKLWNYNTMIKIDDIDFNRTNPGVWTHKLHNLMSTDTFTHWRQYKNDRIIK